MTQHRPGPVDEYREEETGHVPSAPPVPVLVTEPVRVEQRMSRSWTAQQITAGTQPVRVAPHSPTRSSLILVNTGATAAYIAPTESGCTPTAAFPLDVNGSLTLETADEVWCIGSTIAILAQHRDG